MAGLLPDVFWSLTWNDYDSLLYNHYYRHEQAQWGHRAVAHQIYKAVGSFSQGFHAQPIEKWWPLQLLDPAPKAVDAAADNAWWEKMQALAAKSGKRFLTAHA